MFRRRFVASLGMLAAAVFLLAACEQPARQENAAPPPVTTAPVTIADAAGERVATPPADSDTTVAPADGDTRTLDLGGGVSLTLVYIPAGEFLMGSPSSEKDRDDDEGPQTRVRISKGFWMGETEVTQAQWETVMGSNPSRSYGVGENYPVYYVSWGDAMDFCRKVSSRAGVTVTLPTEAQWEYACRAGTTTPFSFGSTISTDQANYDGNYTYGSGRKGTYREKTTAVKSFPSNAFGLYDMHGNVWEWCSDWFGDKLPGGSVTDPAGPNSGTIRVDRGGSWHIDPRLLRAANRGGLTPGFRGSYLGFRVCLPDDQSTRQENAAPPPTTTAPVTIADAETRTLDLGGGVSLTLVYIPAGEFLMGSPSSEEWRSPDEGPQTRVRISKGFWMGETEVTQAQWEAVMGSNPSRFKGANLPVETVSWDDAMDFCRKLSARAGVTVTLPTEAQWEYACRAGTTTRFSSGDRDEDLRGVANLADSSTSFSWKVSWDDGYAETSPVKSFRANAFGLYDMHGNVWEWCSDWFATYPGGSVTDPSGPNSGSYRVIRGGSWNNFAQICRSAYRGNLVPPDRSYVLGFRLVLPVQ